MIQIVYFSPSPAKASGGVKVIYRHAAAINSMRLQGDVSASIIHYENPAARCDWYEEDVPFKSDGLLISSRDFVVLPEHHLYDFWNELYDGGIRFAIFVQSAYLIGGGLGRAEVREAFRKASLILTISEDSTSYVSFLFPELIHKIVPLRWSINADLFVPSPKISRVISYMPRRMYRHARLVCDLVESKLTSDWKIASIDGMTERQVAYELRNSSIFMSFSELEGLALPPVEAALAGNRVVGYHGQGGIEYWDTAIFRRIECGDIQGFAKAVLEEVRNIEGRISFNEYHCSDSQETARTLLRQRFSSEREQELLARFVGRVTEIMTAS